MKLINRELSWLSFNERVLQEALDKNVPLIERLRFLGIYSNNLDEFFRVRVATITRMAQIDNKKVQGFNGTPSLLLDAIKKEVMAQQRKFDLAYQKILKELQNQGFRHVNNDELDHGEIERLNEYFNNKLKHLINPILISKKNKFPRLKESGVFLAVEMIHEGKKDRYALIEIPSRTNRFVVLDKEESRKAIILIDDIIRLNLSKIFSIFNYETIHAHTFKITRDAELDFDDDISVGFMEKMEKSISLRKKGAPTRFVFDEDMSDNLLSFLIKSLKLEKGENIIPGGRYHNFKDFMKFPDFGRKDFIHKKLPPLPHPLLDGQRIIKTVLQKDVLLNYPYQKFDYIVNMLQEAALDPKVKSIHINLYRVAQNSQIINALISAAKNGKNVTTIVELQARFDEENNIYWSNILKENGVKIMFGIPNMKVHSKLILISRTNGEEMDYIAHIGTGNFHEGTAKIYGDTSLLTSNPNITREVKRVFELFYNTLDRTVFRELLVSPFNTRRKFIQLIEDEIKAAKAKKEAKITIKLNNLVDSKLIKKLYDASKAGVKIKLIIRGICALVPGVKNLSENIEVISIVDRFLEHARVMIFHNNGDPKYYISSADWMGRNLDKRIEVTTPIYDSEAKRTIQSMIDIQLSDNQKARHIDDRQSNKYVKNDKDPIRSQLKTYRYFKQKLDH